MFNNSFYQHFDWTAKRFHKFFTSIGFRNILLYWLYSFYFEVTDLHEKSEDSFDNDQDIEFQEHLNENIENELVNVDIREEDSSEVNDSIQSQLKEFQCDQCLKICKGLFRFQVAIFEETKFFSKT